MRCSTVQGCAAEWLCVATAQCVECATVRTWQVGQNMNCAGERCLRFSSFPSDTLVIRYKSLLKDVQEGYDNSPLKQTHSPLWEQRQQRYEGARKRDWQHQGEMEGERGVRWGLMQRKVNSYSVSLINSGQCSSSCCHPLEIITKRDDCQVNSLSFHFYTHPNIPC